MAVIAKREYLEGTYLQDRQLIESELFVAEENLNRAKEYFTYSQKLASKGYVNENQLEADRFAVEKANKDLDAAKTKLKVLDEFTKPKQESTLDSAILIAKAKWEAAQNSDKLEIEKLKDLDDQIAKCTMTAPQDGVVKYAHVTDQPRRSAVHRRRGHDRSRAADDYQAAERRFDAREPYGQRIAGAICAAGFLGRYPPGRVRRPRAAWQVEKVNQYAEPTGWRQANVKEYKAFIHIDDVVRRFAIGHDGIGNDSLRRRAECYPSAGAIDVFLRPEVLLLCLRHSGHWRAQEVKAGPTNDKFFVVESGLKEGDQVALNPRAYVADVSLPKLPPEEIQRAVPQPPSAAARTAIKRGTSKAAV